MAKKETDDEQPDVLREVHKAMSAAHWWMTPATVEAISVKENLRKAIKRLEEHLKMPEADRAYLP